MDKLSETPSMIKCLSKGGFDCIEGKVYKVYQPREHCYCPHPFIVSENGSHWSVPVTRAETYGRGGGLCQETFGVWEVVSDESR